MDTKLQEFVSQTETLASVRNVDTRNPIAYDLDMPSMSMRFRVVGSIVEPSYNGYPINLIWVVLDGNSPYYRRVLQLKSSSANDESIEGRITDVNFLGTWVELENYADLFLYPQYYVSGGGEPGPAGPKGDPGYNIRGQWNLTTSYARNDTVFYLGSSYVSLIAGNTGETPGVSSNWSMVARKGDTPEVDYDRIIADVVAMLKPVLVSLEIRGSTANLFEGQSRTFSVYALLSNGTEEDVTNGVSWSISPDTVGSMGMNGVFTANQVNADVNTSLTASYTDEAGASRSASINFVVKNKVPTAVTVSGAASVNEGTTSQYTATVTYNDGSTVAVPSSGRTWSVNPTTNASINASGLLTTGQVNADATASVVCTYVENGVTVSGSRNITIKNLVVAAKARYLSRSAITNMAQYDSAFVNSLTNELSSGWPHDLDLAIGAGQYGYYAHPKSWGTARFEDKDAPGFPGGWDGARNDILDPSKYGPYEVQATVNGVTEAWLIYRTDMPALGNTRWTISANP